LQSQYEPAMARYPERYGAPSAPADPVTRPPS